MLAKEHNIKGSRQNESHMDYLHSSAATLTCKDRHGNVSPQKSGAEWYHGTSQYCQCHNDCLSIIRAHKSCKMCKPACSHRETSGATFWSEVIKVESTASAPYSAIFLVHDIFGALKLWILQIF